MEQITALGVALRRSRRQDHPALGEKDEAKRIQGWKDADRYIAEQGYVLPLLQYAQPILYKADLAVTHNTSGALLPASTIAKA